MPVITLTAQAKAMLEGYRWPGNVRQLKNVAEQISAIETKREIDGETLSRYLPDVNSTTLPILAGAAHAGAMPTDAERDLLYKLFFEMKEELNQLRNVVAEMKGSQGVGVTETPRHKAALTEGFERLQHTNPSPRLLDEDFVAVEDVSDTIQKEEDLKPKTKEELLRASITAALAKHRGRRKEAAAELFMSERTLYRKIKELGIE